jgi:hypothetical protein
MISQMVWTTWLRLVRLRFRLVRPWFRLSTFELRLVTWSLVA